MAPDGLVLNLASPNRSIHPAGWTFPKTNRSQFLALSASSLLRTKLTAIEGKMQREQSSSTVDGKPSEFALLCGTYPTRVLG